MRQTFEQIFATRDWLLADGATGTNLFHAGLATGYPPELWNVEYPDRVTTSHASFIAAGAKDDRSLTQTKACSLAVLMHTAAGFYSSGFSSDGDRDVAPLSITSL